MYENFINGLWSSISSMVGLLESPAIGNYLFNGLTLLKILLTFFAGGLLIKFFISSFRGGSSGHFMFYRGDRPQKPYKGGDRNG